MKNKTIKTIRLALILLAVYGCEDLFVEDITQENIQLLAPADSLRTAHFTHNFWWTALEGASQYKLEVVLGTFEFSERLVLDSTLSLNSFEYSLLPGNYQWRVQGVNSNYNSSFSTFNLFIDTSIVLTNSTVVLTHPQENFVSSQLTSAFSWEPLSNADHYLWELREASGNLIYKLEDLTMPSVYYNFSEDGHYNWQVKAFNNTSNTFTSFSSRSLFIDSTPPEAVVLLHPIDTAQLTGDSVVFQWISEQYQEGATASTDYLYIAADSIFSHPPISLAQGIETYTQTLNTGTYYWKVLCMDAAGNSSPENQIHQFYLDSE